MIYNYQKIPMSFSDGLQGNHEDDLSQQPSHQQHAIPHQHHQTPYYFMPSLNTINNNDQDPTNIYNQRTSSSYSLPPLYPSMTASSHTTPQLPPTNHPQKKPDSSFNQSSQLQEQSRPSGSRVPRIPKSHGDLRQEKQQVAAGEELPLSPYTPVAYLNFLSFIMEVKQRLTPEAYTRFQTAFTTFRVTAIPRLSSTPQFANNLHAVRFALAPHHDLLEQLDTLFVQPAITPLAPKRKRTPPPPCPSSCSFCPSAAVTSAPVSVSTTTPTTRSTSGDEIPPTASCSSAAAATPGLLRIPEVSKTGQISMQIADLGDLAASVSVMAEAMVGSSGAGEGAGELGFQGLEALDLRALRIEGLEILEGGESSAGIGMGVRGGYFEDMEFRGGSNR